MTAPEPPAWYQIPREETGINVRPSGTQEDTGQPPFNDLFTEQIPKIMESIREFFVDWPAHIKAGLDTGIDWLQTVADLDLEWLRALLHKVVDTTAAVFDVSSWVAFLDTAITSAANLVADSFATVFDWIASLADGAVRFVEHSCNLDLTWLHNLIDQARVWSTSHVDLTSQADFVDGVTDGGATTNPLMGILFGPLFQVMHAGQTFGSDVWHAITVFGNSPGESDAWPTMTTAITDAWNTMVDEVLAAVGSPKTHADFVDPATATEAALRNNPLTGWLFGSTYAGGTWLNTAIHAITDPINGFFDSVRRYINQMIQSLHLGYLDANWKPVAAFTTPPEALPGGGEVLTPGVSNDTNDGMSWRTDPSIPPAPTGVMAFPIWDLSVSGFPAGSITYAIAAVKNNIEGPATLVTVFVGTLSPPNTNGRVDTAWNPMPGHTFRIYRKVDATFTTALDWRLITSPANAGTLLSPVQDKNPRTSGTTAHPKTDAELAAQIVTAVKTTADTAKTNNQTLMDTIVATATDDFTLDDPEDASTKRPNTTGQTSNDVADTLSNWPATHVSAPSEMSAWLLMQQTLAQIASGLADDDLDEASPADAGQAAQTLSQKVNLALLMGQVALLEGRARPIWRCGDPSSDPSIPSAALIWNSASLTTPFPNGRYAVGGLVVTEAVGPRDYVSVALNVPSSLLDVRLAIYYMDSAGALVPLPGYTPINIGPDIAPSVNQPAGSLGLFKFSIPAVMVNPANVFAIELINMSTTGSLQMPLGQVIGPGWWAIPGAAFVRTSAKINTSTPAVAIPRTSISWNAMVPFVTLGYSGGGAVMQSDNVQEFTASGTWNPPTWWRPGIDYLDVGAVGGAGSGGTGWTGPGNPGTASSVDVPGYRTVTGAAGTAGPSGTTTVANSTGKSPGNRKTAAGRLLIGGGPSSIVAGFSTVGKSPGGGSSGAAFAGLYAYGGAAGGWDLLDGAQPNVTSLAITVGAGGAGVDTGAWASLKGGGGKVWVIARQNRNA